jgi:hypothetical protein
MITDNKKLQSRTLKVRRLMKRAINERVEQLNSGLITAGEFFRFVRLLDLKNDKLDGLLTRAILRDYERKRG